MSVFFENEYEGTAGIDCEMIAGQVVEAAVDEERAVMEEKQEEILQFVHYTRD